jgi:DNA-binding NarL/FixJ family response regulator
MIPIAIADDNPLFRNTLASFLEKEKGMKLLFLACDGKDLLDQLATFGLLPDIVLMDINMPILDGNQATRFIKEAYPCVKVIVLSAFHNKELLSTMLEAGARGYLSKHIEPEIFLEAIQVVNDGKYFIETDHGKYNSYKTVPKLKSNKISQDKLMLTEKQKLFLQLCAEGKSYSEIGKHMKITDTTANKYRELLCERFNKNNKGELIHFAIQTRLVSILK